MGNYDERLKRVQDAIELKEPDRVPICTKLGIGPYIIDGCSNRDAMYGYTRAIEANVNFYKKFPMLDADQHVAFTNGLGNELAGTTILDWPGRPGTKVPDNSTYQVMEYEYMSEEEYPDVLHDYTGFMLQKYIPRAFPKLAGLSSIKFNPANLLSISYMNGLFSDEALEAYELLGKIAVSQKETNAANAECSRQIAEMGFPPFYTGGGEVPFDVIGDYYRGTIPTLLDQLEHEEEMAEFCDRIADIEIASFQRFKGSNAPVKRVFFPMHKGMDGFMSAEQYENIYWKPFKKIINALVDMDVTPYLYTEGKYNTRLEQLRDLPKGKCMIHFETVDMKKAKEIVGDNSCIVGNLSAYLLEMGTPEQVTEEVKKLLDICMPGGGYIFDCNGSIDIAKEENIDAMYNTLLKYGSYK